MLAAAAAFGSQPTLAAEAAIAPADGPFDGSTVRHLAASLAKQAYDQPDARLPTAIDKLTYDQYRGIRFKADRALWLGRKLPFTVGFFPRGALYRMRVDVFEVSDSQAKAVPYSPDLFDYADPAFRVPDALGYAGLRIRAPINRPDVFDEACVFLGASYFRAVAKGQVFGLSARGLAIGTGSARGEEFASFRAFWLETPREGVNSLVLHALLDSKSATGAYRFTIHPGDVTVFDVESVLYPRVDLVEPGIGPLTSMYFFDAKERRRFDDWRPAVHDSDGLAISNGRGEQLWRPLANPIDLQMSGFADTNPRGFGLSQRKRGFADYQDLEVGYEKRPALWVEPIGDWGQGTVDLVEIPTANETNDNIVAFWRPKDKLNGKGEYPFTYRLHWGWERPGAAPLARVVATRVGAGEAANTRVFVLDFVGDTVKGLAADAKPRVELGSNVGKISNVLSLANPETGGWRISFDLTPNGEKLVEMHCLLLGEQGPLTETWIYRWTA